MVFDRTAINTGRRMQDFGLCDLKGEYQNSAKLRAKGFFVAAFLKATDRYSIDVAKQLQEWTSMSDKLVVAAIVISERAEAEALAKNAGLTYPVLWDGDTYVTPLWAVNSVPALFITNDQGVVLARVMGADAGEISSAKTLLTEAIQKADAAAKAAAEAAAAAAAQAAPPPAPAAAPAGKK